MAAPKFNRLELDGQVFYWLAIDSKKKVNDGPWERCVIVTISRRPEGGGGFGTTFPSWTHVTADDVIETIRAFRTTTGRDIE